MEHSNSEVSIDQIARLAGQAGVYTHHNTREIDRAALLLAVSGSPDETRVSTIRRAIHALTVFLRG